jgi:hypothetical protein
MSKGKTSRKQAYDADLAEILKPSETKTEKKQNVFASGNQGLPLTKQNYQLLAAFVGVIAVGFILLYSKEFVDATEFSVPLYIAPLVLTAGYVGVIFAIMWRPKRNSN